jgi:hypothetical protein
MALPDSPLYAELTLSQIDIAPFERSNFAAPESCFAAEENDETGIRPTLPCRFDQPLELFEVMEGRRRWRNW